MSARELTPPEAMILAGQQVSVGTVHLTVTSHVRDDQSGRTRLVQDAQSLPHVATLAAPTARGQAIAAHVQAHGNALTERIDGLAHRVDVVESLRRDVDARGP